MTTAAELLDAEHQRPSKWVPDGAPFGSTWDDFRAWVPWLDTAYELELPTCWDQHAGIVNLMAALWHAWRSVYAAPAGQADIPPAHAGPAQWHTGLLLPVRDRLQRPDGCPGSACRTRPHR